MAPGCSPAAWNAAVRRADYLELCLCLGRQYRRALAGYQRLLPAGLKVTSLGGGLGPVAGIPWLPVELAAGLGLLLPVAAALYPARVAARVTIVTALQFE